MENVLYRLIREKHQVCAVFHIYMNKTLETGSCWNVADTRSTKKKNCGFYVLFNYTLKVTDYSANDILMPSNDN